MAQHHGRLLQDRHDRRDRGRRKRSERDLRRHRRARGARRDDTRRRRRLQIDRRRQDLEEDRTRNKPAYFAHHHPSEESRHRLGRGTGSALLAVEGARHLQVDRRRTDVEEHAVRQRKDRCRRTVDGCQQSAHHLRGDVGTRPPAVEGDQRRAGKRALQVDRQRRNLDENDRRPPRRDGQNGDRRQPQQSGEGLRADRERFIQGHARSLRIDRRGGKLAAGFQRQPAHPARLVLHRTLHRSEEREHDICPERAVPSFGGRRKDVAEPWRNARRFPRSVDQPRQPEQHDHLERRRRRDQLQPRKNVEHASQYADRAVLPDQCR